MADRSGHTIALDLHRGVRWLSVIAGLLLAANAAVHVIAMWIGTNDATFRVVRRLLSVDEEAAVPAFFSAVLLLIASALLWAVARLERAEGAKNWPWLVLSVGFLYLALDESVSLHEHWGRIVAVTGVERSGYLYWQWVVPAIGVITMVGLVLARFWWHLPPATRLGFAIAGGLYLTGAVGFEIISGPVAEAEGLKSLRYLVLTSTEEALEIIGILAFLGVLARHLDGRAVLGVTTVVPQSFGFGSDHAVPAAQVVPSALYRAHRPR